MFDNSSSFSCKVEIKIMNIEHLFHKEEIHMYQKYVLENAAEIDWEQTV